MADSNKRPRVDSDESSPDSSEAKRFRENLLVILEEEDATVDRDSATQDLDSVMKIFEEEIGLLSSPDSLPLPSQTTVSDSGESLPDLGFLLEASDDELGLPPTSEEKNEEKGSDVLLRGAWEAVGFDQLWGFDDEIPSYDELGFGIRVDDENVDESVFFWGSV